MFMVDNGTDMPHRDTLTTAEAVDILGVTRAAIHKWRMAGKLKPVEAKGRTVLWDRQSILNLSKTRTVSRTELLRLEIMRMERRLRRLKAELRAVNAYCTLPKQIKKWQAQATLFSLPKGIDIPTLPPARPTGSNRVGHLPNRAGRYGGVPNRL